MEPIAQHIDWLGYFLKWFIPFVAAGTVGVGIKFIIDTYGKGREQRQQQEWDSHATEVNNKIDEVRQVSDQRTEELNKRINAMNENLELLMRSNRLQNLRGLQRGGRELLHQDRISEAEYRQFEEEYNVYKECGGDGWADEIHNAVHSAYQSQLLK